MVDKKPLMVIIAGPNGSGKTTLSAFFLKKMGIKEFINTDEIARGLSPYNSEGQAIDAGRISLKRRAELISQKVSFAVETTLSGNESYIQQAIKAGYEINMIYLYTEDIKINVKRVQNRKKEGGHSVPIKDIKRRYGRSLKNFFSKFAPLCDKFEVYNSLSMPPVLVAVGGKGPSEGITTVKIIAKQAHVWEEMWDTTVGE